MAITIAQAIDVGIQEVIETPGEVASALIDLYEMGMPSSLSMEEYLEFVKRNLAKHNALVIEHMKEHLR